MAKDCEELEAVQKELKRKLREARNSYKEKTEAKMGQNNTKEVWNEMKKMTGCGKTTPGVKGGPEIATNLFFSRFDMTPLANSGCRSESPSPTTAPIHTSAVGSASLPINNLPPTPSFCSSAVVADSPPSLQRLIPLDIDTTTVIVPHPQPHLHLLPGTEVVLRTETE